MTASPPRMTTPHRLRWAWREQRALLALWALPVGLLCASTLWNSAHLGRWALLLAVVALLVSTTRLARYVVTRITQIVALWEEDVPQAEGPQRLYAVPARHRGDRARDHG